MRRARSDIDIVLASIQRCKKVRDANGRLSFRAPVLDRATLHSATKACERQHSPASSTGTRSVIHFYAKANIQVANTAVKAGAVQFPCSCGRKIGPESSAPLVPFSRVNMYWRALHSDPIRAIVATDWMPKTSPLTANPPRFARSIIEGSDWSILGS